MNPTWCDFIYGCVSEVAPITNGAQHRAHRRMAVPHPRRHAHGSALRAASCHFAPTISARHPDIVSLAAANSVADPAWREVARTGATRSSQESRTFTPSLAGHFGRTDREKWVISAKRRMSSRESQTKAPCSHECRQERAIPVAGRRRARRGRKDLDHAMIDSRSHRPTTTPRASA